MNEIVDFFRSLGLGNFIVFLHRLTSDAFVYPGMRRFPILGDMGLFGLRLGIGVIFLIHGIQKFHFWSVRHAEHMSHPMLVTIRVLAVLETLGSLAILTGFFTQIAALWLAVIMLGALYFKIFIWRKRFTGDGGWELDFILLMALSALVLFGGGAITLDRMVLDL